MRALALAICLLLPGVGWGQEAPDGGLGAIRTELAALYGELRALEDHLTSGEAAGTTVAGASALQRLEAIERELQRLTARSEELEFHIQRIVRDGTARVSALERRLCALEDGCDPAELEDQPVLGGIAPRPAAPLALPAGPQLAVDERAAFDRARALFDAGDYASAVDAFTAHLQTWPGGPLSSEAELLRGRSLEQTGDVKGAARAYLTAFSSDKDGPLAAESLTALGQAMAALGQTLEACVTLGEVATRFSGQPPAIVASSARAQLDCP